MGSSFAQATRVWTTFVSAPVDFSNIERFVNEPVDDFRLQFSELLCKICGISS
jgi:hypothetical protein